MEKIYNITIQGYFKDEIRVQFPHTSGVYFVYRGILNVVAKPPSAILNELIYIGETGDLYSRHNEHNCRQNFLNALQYGEQLFYCYAEISLPDAERKRIEASFIHELQPSLNLQNQKMFSYDRTTINILGDRHAFIPSKITAPSYQ